MKEIRKEIQNFRWITIKRSMKRFLTRRWKKWLKKEEIKILTQQVGLGWRKELGGRNLQLA